MSLAPKPLKLFYGPDSLQFGELWLPEKPLAPIVTVIHGGCWRSKYDLTLMDDMSLDLRNRGYAVWNLEYRRTEDRGGGWPGTFTDVARGLKHLKSLAQNYPIDIDRILLMGHSAGGHLALWLGAQRQLNAESELIIEDLPDIMGIISLAGITDLITYFAPTGCGDNVIKLIGGNPAEVPDRYTEGSPISHLPLSINQKLITGEKDDTVPIEHITPYYNLAMENNDNIELIIIPEAGHFEVITPGSIAWPYVLEALEDLISVNRQ